MTEKVLLPNELIVRRKTIESEHGTVALVMGSFTILQPGNLYAVSHAKKNTSHLFVLREKAELQSLGSGSETIGAQAGGAKLISCLRDVTAICEADSIAHDIAGLRPYIMIDCLKQSEPGPLRLYVRSAAERIVDIAALQGCFTKDVAKAIATGCTPINIPYLCRQHEDTDLLRIVSVWREDGKKIVTVNGCFDILHNGHVKMLSEARGMGDELIVLVNDDASVRAYKGSRRPVFPVQFRLQALAALEPVSLAHPFSGDNPLAMLSAIRPDIHVKGGSFDQERVRSENELIKKWGGRVEFCPLVEGYSTTGFIQPVKPQNPD